MRSFRYAALESTSGREVQGEVAAVDAAAAAAELRRRALLPIALEEALARSVAAPAARSGPGFFASLRMTRTRDTVLVLRQLALMLRTGLTILQALDVAQKQCPKPRLAAALGRIRLAVETGSTVSAAFERESRYLPPIASRL